MFSHMVKIIGSFPVVSLDGFLRVITDKFFEAVRKGIIESCLNGSLANMSKV